MTQVAEWPEVFMRVGFRVEHLTQDFLLGTPGRTGSFFCKACGKFVEGSREGHYKNHAKEIKAFEEKRKAEAKAAKLKALGVRATKPKAPKSEFYTNPCRGCGAQIPRTGKRGKPPVKCATCRGEK